MTGQTVVATGRRTLSETVERGRLALGELGAIDLAVYRAVAATPSPTLDRALRRLSRSADRSLLWLSIAAALASQPGAPRRAAVRGVRSIMATSATVNLGAKKLLPRSRPDRHGASVPAARHARMPGSGSFPSGHAASAFAFAGTVGRELPWASLPLHLLAGAVAYSRVHTGVHFPGDVIVGGLTGAAIGAAMSAVTGTAAPAAPAVSGRPGRRPGRRGERPAAVPDPVHPLVIPRR
jgi:undecaprenyl-diphosphatase